MHSPWHKTNSPLMTTHGERAKDKMHSLTPFLQLATLLAGLSATELFTLCPAFFSPTHTDHTHRHTVLHTTQSGRGAPLLMRTFSCAHLWMHSSEAPHIVLYMSDSEFTPSHDTQPKKYRRVVLYYLNIHEVRVCLSRLPVI